MPPLALRFFTRPIKTFSYSSNETQSFDLPRNYAYSRLFFRLTGTLTIGTANATALLNRNPLGLIKKIRIIADGKDTIKSLSGSDLYELNIIDHKVVGELTATGLTVAAHTFNAFFSVDFGLGKGANSRLDTFLKSWNLATLQIEVDWGTTTDLVTPDSSTTLTLASTQLDVYSQEAIGFPRDRSFALNKEYIIEKTVTADSSEFQIDMPVGNAYRRFVLIATDAGVREDDIITKIELRSGQETFLNFDEYMLQNVNSQKQEQTSHVSGVYVLDMAELGSLRDILDVSRASSLEFVLGVAVGTGATKIKVIPQEIVLPSV